MVLQAQLKASLAFDWVFMWIPSPCYGPPRPLARAELLAVA